METIYLQGSEDVSRAAGRMQSAADQISSAMNSFASSVEMLQMHMTNFMNELYALEEKWNGRKEDGVLPQVQGGEGGR